MVLFLMMCVKMDIGRVEYELAKMLILFLDAMPHSVKVLRHYRLDSIVVPSMSVELLMDKYSQFPEEVL